MVSKNSLIFAPGGLSNRPLNYYLMINSALLFCLWLCSEALNAGLFPKSCIRIRDGRLDRLVTPPFTFSLLFVQ